LCQARCRIGLDAFVNLFGCLAVESLLRSISCFYGVPIRYTGLEEKQNFAEALADCTDAASQVIQFALFGTNSIEPRSGANRNLLLLDTVDRLFFSTDDDTKCS
jgi:hypothetical protein